MLSGPHDFFTTEGIGLLLIYSGLFSFVTGEEGGQDRSAYP